MFAQINSSAMLRFQHLTMRASLGAAGITAHKQEGDHATPAGRLALLRVLYRADRIARPRAAVPVEPLSPEDGWCDDPASPAYNQQIRLPHDSRHEVLWRRDGMYDLIGVLAWNVAPVRPGQGSAIFLHVARPGYAPTEGCIALAMEDLRLLLEKGLTGVEVEA